MEDRIARYFEPEEMIPAAGQGILAIQGRKDVDYSYLKGYGDENATYAALAERAFVRYLNGGCSSPVAAHARVEDGQIILRGLYYDENTGNYEKGLKKGSAEAAEELGISLAKELQERSKAYV